MEVPGVYLPNAYERKEPSAATSFTWFWVFPATRLSGDPRAELTRRHHIRAIGVGSALKRAAAAASIPKKVSAHTLRHSYATHLLPAGAGLRSIDSAAPLATSPGGLRFASSKLPPTHGSFQEALGHASIKTTEVYLHIVDVMRGKLGNPLDSLEIPRPE